MESSNYKLFVLQRWLGTRRDEGELALGWWSHAEHVLSLQQKIRWLKLCKKEDAGATLHNLPISRSSSELSSMLLFEIRNIYLEYRFICTRFVHFTVIINIINILIANLICSTWLVFNAKHFLKHVFQIIYEAKI